MEAPSSAADPDQDGSVANREDGLFDRSNGSGSGRSDSSGGQFVEQNAAHMYRTVAQTGIPDSHAGLSIASGYPPFMMQQLYQSAMQGGSSVASSMPAAAASSFFFSQNLLPKDADGNGSTGSPLNLQMAGGQPEQRRIGGSASHGDYNGAGVQDQHGMPPAAVSPGMQRARASPHLVAGGSPFTAAALQPAQSAYPAVAAGNPGQGRFPADVAGYSKVDSPAKPGEYPPPPKKPLTPYMRYNRFMWDKVKASNPGLGVCEISSAIGRLWRELVPEEKQKFNDGYTLDKARYDEELKVYLKTTGLRSSDLVKPKAKKKAAPAPAAPARRPAAPPAGLPSARPAAGSGTAAGDHQQLQQHAHVMANHQQQQQQQQQLQALMGLQGSLPLGMPVSFQNMGMLSGFPQMWAATAAAGQQYAGGLVNASQLHELYGGAAAGGVNGLEGPPPAHNQQPSLAPTDAQTAALYRYQQSFM